MTDKPLVILHGEIKTPPLSQNARIQAGFLLRQLQKGILLSMPDSRPMPSIGKGCHALRIRDSASDKIWRIIYRIDPDAILIAEVIAKKTQKTPQQVISTCQKRFATYDSEVS